MSQYVHVCICDVALRYGGSEEGGWWYEAGEVVSHVTLRNPSENRIKQVAKKLKREAQRRNRLEGRRPIHSVLSDGEFEICIFRPTPGASSNRAPKGFPDSKPTYS